MVTSSTSRHALHPTKANRARRKSKIHEIQAAADKGKHRNRSGSPASSKDTGIVPDLIKKVTNLGSSEDSKLDRSQMIDLVVEDEEAEAVERVRARKEGSPEWNKHEAKHFVHTFPEEDQSEEVREGYEPTAEYNKNADQQHTIDASFGGESENSKGPDAEEAEQWKSRKYDEDDNSEAQSRQFTYDHEESNVWNSPKR